MTKPTTKPQWRELQAHGEKIATTTLAALFAADAQRTAKFSVTLDGLTADFSKNHLTAETVSLLVKLAEAQDLPAWRTRMFGGEKINTTEKRAVLHTALRAPAGQTVCVDNVDVMPEIAAAHRRMQAFVAAVREGRWLGATGKKIAHIVNIGIGGSDLGPRLAVGALRDFCAGPKLHFVANVDAADLTGALDGLDPAETLFVVVSKTFTTQETLLNAQSARQWLVAALGEDAVVRHCVAVSVNAAAVAKFGIAADNMFPMWDWVGGRYSLWSAVGLSIALAVGWDHFAALLAGAAAMDAHFRDAPLERNMPVLLGLTGLWYRNFRGSACHAILPYCEGLRELPRFLQQLEMESNGKSVTREGEAVDYVTSPAIFGECGTVGQHSFHQWLHQGTDATPTDFIGVRHDALNRPAHHAALLANLVAQTEALRLGRQDADAGRVNPGNRPSTTLWLDKLDPHSLGMLLALYEHKVFVQGIIWNINSFDQWGVELGKKLAAEALAGA